MKHAAKFHPGRRNATVLKPWLPRLIAGWAAGMAVQAVIPGQHPAGWILASLLSVCGAAGGATLAQWVVPQDLLPSGEVLLAGLGAIASLLLEAVCFG